MRAEVNSQLSLFTSSSDGFLRRVLHSVSDDEVQSGLFQHELSFFDVGAFQPNHDRFGDVQVAGRFDDAARNHIASDNAAENVNQHGLYVRIGQQDSEGVLDPLLRSPAADVQKVRRLAAGQLDDVHRRHRQPRAIDHAGDVAVEL